MRRTFDFFPEAQRLAMADAFAHVLGNTCALQRTTLACEWNVMGPLSRAAAALFRVQSAEMYRAQSVIACRIRVMGKIATPDESDLVLSRPDRSACAGSADPAKLVRILAEGHERTIVSIRAATDVAIDMDDRGSLVVLDTRLLAHEWHLTELSNFAE